MRSNIVTRKVFGLLILIIAVGACVGGANGSGGAKVTVVFDRTSGGQTEQFDLEVVSKPATRSYGLMYRQKLEKTEGMLFVFPDEAPRTFWMKNTYIPLDIIFLDNAKKIVSIHSRMAPFSTKQIASNKAAKYAIELNAGACESSKISVDDTAEFELPSTVEIE